MAVAQRETMKTITKTKTKKREHAMSNKATNDKGSILVDVEELLDAFEPAFMRMPKIRRIHGAAAVIGHIDGR